MIKNNRKLLTDNIIKKIDLRIKQFYSKGMKFLYFFDDTFILNKNFVDDFCNRYKQKGFDKQIKWTANVRANLVTDEIIKNILFLKESQKSAERIGNEARKSIEEYYNWSRVAYETEKILEDVIKS